MTLPTEKQTRSKTITPASARIMLVGTPKVGKTTLAAAWAPDKTLIIDTHRGTTLLDGEHYVEHVTNWQKFVQTVDELVAGGHHYDTVMIDLIDDVWRFCDVAHATKGSVAASAVDDYQKAIRTAETVFYGTIGKLTSSPLGVWFLSHAREKQDGNITRYGTKLDNRVETYIKGVCQGVFLAEALGPKRVLHTQPSAKFEAGSRFNLPEPMDLDARALWAAMNASLNPKPPAAPKATEKKTAVKNGATPEKEAVTA